MFDSTVSVPDAPAGSFVAIGNFDGVHLGHREMLRRLRTLADQHGVPAVVVTFDPHPLSVLRPDVQVPRLTTIAQRTELLTMHGADKVIVLPVSSQLLEMEPKEFLDSILVNQLQIRGIVEGPNFRFGRNRAGDIQMLQQFCREAQIECHVLDIVKDDGHWISSSRIRRLMQDGMVRDANALLGREYQLSGTVTRGAGRGRTLGYPTANLDSIEVMLPRHGVYAGRASIDGVDYVTALSIGPNPTFGETANKVECHFERFHGDLYEHVVHVNLVGEIRPLESFETVDDLKTQIASDIVACHTLVKSRL